MIEAIVSGNGTFYKDGTERWGLHIIKSANHGLPNKDGKQIPITVVIGGIEYRGTIGSRSDFTYIYVAAKLWDPDGKEHKQTHLLRDNGFLKKQRVQLSIAGNQIILLKDESLNAMDTQSPSNGEVPTREEVENNLHRIDPKKNGIDEEALKRAIEFSFAAEKRKLKSDWWETTKINLVEWSKKG